MSLLLRLACFAPVPQKQMMISSLKDFMPNCTMLNLSGFCCSESCQAHHLALCRRQGDQTSGIVYCLTRENADSLAHFLEVCPGMLAIRVAMMRTPEPP